MTMFTTRKTIFKVLFFHGVCIKWPITTSVYWTKAPGLGSSRDFHHMQATSHFSTDPIYLRLLITRKLLSNFMERKRNRHYIQHFLRLVQSIEVPNRRWGKKTKKKRVCCLVTQSCPTLFVTPWTAAHQAPLSMKFPRQEYLSGLPFPSWFIKVISLYFFH